MSKLIYIRKSGSELEVSDTSGNRAEMKRLGAKLKKEEKKEAKKKAK
jgi:phage gp16-like protein